MNILFCTDKNYLMPMVVSITSVFENNKNEKIKIFIFHSGLEDFQINILLEMAKKYNQEINPIFIDDYYYSDAPTLRWTREAYFRLLISEKLPLNLDRILYLDCDTIVNKSLNSLYKSIFDDNYHLIALEEIDSNQVANLGLKFKKYYQSGVILINLKSVRNIISYKKTVDVLNKIYNKIVAVDQDIINVLFDGNIKNIEKIYNDCLITNFSGKKINRLFNYANKDEIDNVAILHYATGKPWNNLYSGSCEKIWYKYLKLSPYAFLYNEKFNKFKYKILRAGIFKVLFFEYIKLTPYINNLFSKIFSKDKYEKLKSFYRKKIK